MQVMKPWNRSWHTPPSRAAQYLKVKTWSVLGAVLTLVSFRVLTTFSMLMVRAEPPSWSVEMVASIWVLFSVLNVVLKELRSLVSDAGLLPVTSMRLQVV